MAYQQQMHQVRNLFCKISLFFDKAAYYQQSAQQQQQPPQQQLAGNTSQTAVCFTLSRIQMIWMRF
jgi:hypothetical protein